MEIILLYVFQFHLIEQREGKTVYTTIAWKHLNYLKAFLCSESDRPCDVCILQAAILTVMLLPFRLAVTAYETGYIFVVHLLLQALSFTMLSTHN